MAASQNPWGLAAVKGTISHPAWQEKPSWYLVANQDKMISPVLERQMAERAKAKISDVNASHAVYVSQPRVVAALIEKAAREANATN
jgi:pimeloyl-ACP methyl ester carboxylesterase